MRLNATSQRHVVGKKHLSLKLHVRAKDMAQLASFLDAGLPSAQDAVIEERSDDAELCLASEHEKPGIISTSPGFLTTKRSDCDV